MNIAKVILINLYLYGCLTSFLLVVSQIEDVTLVQALIGGAFSWGCVAAHFIGKMW